MAHYFVTGAAGFIASFVAKKLLTEGHFISGIDNLNDAYDVRLKHWRLEFLKQYPRFCFEKVDVTDANTLNQCMVRMQQHAGMPIQGIFHLAARAGVRPSVEMPGVYFDTNLTGTLHVLESCRALNIRKMVLASTSSVYGNHQIPFEESYVTDFPLSPYAASKKAAEVLSYTYFSLHKINTTVLRYFTVFGPAGRPDMSLFRFVQKIYESRPIDIYGDGLQSRDFTYVEDVASGTISAMNLTGYQIINLGSDKPYTLQQMLDLCERSIGKKAILQFKPEALCDVRATWADVSKAQSLLHWKAQVSAEAGIAQMVSWYKANRDWAKDVDTGA